jgi:tetratricopeptide (TPR) repeat protein
MLSGGERDGVLAHVEACEGCQQALAAGAGATPQRTGAGRAGRAAGGDGEECPPIAPGGRVSRYVVLEPIGQGAMGVVYAALDPELGRRVALKLLRPEGRHVEELRGRLQREAQALARLTHPNVVAIHDVGACQGRLFLAMDLVEGSTLARWLREPRTADEVLHVFTQAGRGLAAAHQAGLVHRDFKPANVLVGRDGSVRVTDFGLASTVDPPDTPTPSPAPEPPGAAAAVPGGAGALVPWEETPPPGEALTATGALLGTPAYMAPEQLRGEDASALSDQFSFCVALHEALLGERPFRGDCAEGLLASMATAGPPPPVPSGRRLPRHLLAVLRRGLSLRPSDRFPSMEALLAALRPAARRRRRARLWVAASACAAGLLCVGLEYAVAHRREVRCEQEVARLEGAWGPQIRARVEAAFLSTGSPSAPQAWERVAAALDAHAERWRALRTGACHAAQGAGAGAEAAWQAATCLDARLWQLSAVTGLLVQADGQRVQDALQLVASLDGLDACRDAPALTARPQPPEPLRAPVDAARRRLADARALLEAGQYAQGLEVAGPLVREAEGLGYRPLLAEALLMHGRLLGLAGRLEEAEPVLYRGLWAAEAGRDDETAARVWGLLVWVVGEQRARVAEASRLVEHARASVERLGRERFPDVTADLHLRLGGLRLVEGRLEEAAAEYEAGLAFARERFGPDSLRTANFLSGLGRARSRQLRHADALALWRQAQAIRERVWEPGNPAHALNLNNIAISLAELGRTAEALATLQRSLALLELARGVDHPSLAAPLTNIAYHLRRQGRLAEARAHLRRAVALFEKSRGPDHPNTTVALCSLGMAAYEAGELEEALGLQREALARVERSLGPDSPRAALPHEYLGLVRLRQRHFPEARRHLTRALLLLEREHGEDTPLTSTIHRALAELALQTGRPAEALARCERAERADARTSGADGADVASDLSCRAEALLAHGAPDQALPLLERARHAQARVGKDVLEQARTAFLLARAVRALDRGPADRARAEALAVEAEQQLEAHGVRGSWLLAQVRAWHARHPGPAPRPGPSAPAVPTSPPGRAAAPEAPVPNPLVANGVVP